MNSRLKKTLGIIGAVIGLILVSCGLTGCEIFDGNNGGASQPNSSTPTAEIPGLPPDPGEAGKATLTGVTTNSKGVRDDIYRYIVINNPDSEKTREALFQKARVWQNVLLDSADKAKSISNAEEFLRASDCLQYVRPGDYSLFLDSLKSVFLNTDARHRAYEAFDRQIDGQSFGGLSINELKEACNFNPDSLPN